MFVCEERTPTWAKEELNKLWEGQECSWSSEITWNQGLELHRVTSLPLLPVSLCIWVSFSSESSPGRGITAPRSCHTSGLPIPTPKKELIDAVLSDPNFKIPRVGFI